jgi:hypothetical protein
LREYSNAPSGSESDSRAGKYSVDPDDLPIDRLESSGLNDDLELDGLSVDRLEFFGSNFGSELDGPPLQEKRDHQVWRELH